jgi:hypothetical protein
MVLLPTHHPPQLRTTQFQTSCTKLSSSPSIIILPWALRVPSWIGTTLTSSPFCWCKRIRMVPSR